MSNMNVDQIKTHLNTLNTNDEKLEYLYFQKKELARIIYALENTDIKNYTRTNNNLVINTEKELAELIDEIEKSRLYDKCQELDMITDVIYDQFLPILKNIRYKNMYRWDIYDPNIKEPDMDTDIYIEIMDLGEQVKLELKIYRICENYVNSEIEYLNKMVNKEKLNESKMDEIKRKEIINESKLKEIPTYNYNFDKIKEHTGELNDIEKYKYYLRIDIEIKRILNAFQITEFKNFDGNIYFGLKEFRKSVDHILKKEKCSEITQTVEIIMNVLKEDDGEKDFRKAITCIEIDLMIQSNRLVKIKELVSYELEFLEKVIEKNRPIVKYYEEDVAHNVDVAQPKEVQKDEKDSEPKKEKKMTIDMAVNLYIKACKKLKIKEPTIEQLFDLTEIQKSIWNNQMNKSAFWHLVKDEVEHSINQAKKQETRDFWIEVKLNAEDKYADSTAKEYKFKLKYIDELPSKKKRSL